MFEGLDGGGHFKATHLPPKNKEICIQKQQTVQILKLMFLEFFFSRYTVLVYGQKYVKVYKANLMVTLLTTQCP